MIDNELALTFENNMYYVKLQVSRARQRQGFIMQSNKGMRIANRLHISVLYSPLPYRFRGVCVRSWSRSMRVCEAVCVYGGGIPYGTADPRWGGAVRRW